MGRGRSPARLGLGLALLIGVGLFQAGAVSAAANPQSRVAGGYYAPAWFAPSTTYIESGEGSCTASLIAPKRVLTAAHCVYGDTNPRDWTVRVGVRNLDNPAEGETRAITGIAMHPNTQLPEGGAHANHAFYDVAVMFLKRPAVTAPATIGTGSDWGSSGYAVGWGHPNYDHENGGYTPYLKGVTLRLGNDSQCASWTNTNVQHYYPAIHICAYDTEGDDCITHGDSGGPLMVLSGGSYKLIGVTSFFPLQHQLEWGPCDNVAMTGFTWVAGPTISSWPLTAFNPGCTAARKQLRKVKRKYPFFKKGIRKSRRNVRAACDV